MDLLAVAALMALAALLSVLQLGTESVWLDESSSVAIATRPPLDLLAHVSRVELNGSIYYLLLHPWIAIFGQSEAAIRALSVLCVVLAVPFIHLTGRMLFDRRVALAATLIVVTSAFIVSYAQEARAYALALLLTSIATFLFVRGLRRPTWFTWLLYAAFGALAVYAHFFSAFILVAHAASLLVIRRDRVRWRPILISFGLMAVMVIPAARFALFVDNAACRTAWVPSIDVERLRIVLWEIAGANDWLLLAIGLAVLVAVAAMVVRRMDRDARWPVLFVLLLVAVPLGLSLGISLYRPLLATRYLIVAFPGLALLVAFGLASLRPRILGSVGLIAVVALSAWSLTSYFVEERKPDMRGIAQFVDQVTDEGDAALVYQQYGYPAHLLRYYLDEGTSPSMPMVIDLPTATEFQASRLEGCPVTPSDEYQAAIQDTVAGLAGSHDRVAIVIRRARDDAFEPVVIRALEERYQEVERVVWGGSRWWPMTELRVYDRLDASEGSAGG
jgi:mannosyltransferase